MDASRDTSLTPHSALTPHSELPAHSAEHWADIERLFTRALEVPPEERRGWLASNCADDAALRTDVEALLAAHDALGTDDGAGFLGRLELERAAALLDTESEVEAGTGPRAGTTVGPYRIERALGHGGMGVVYLAERADGQFEQRVALKLIRRGMDSNEIHRRFRAERRILARLEHPHIARLLDGGITEHGQPWFAMEYVEGARITVHCDARSLGIDDRIRLVEQVSEAVRYAHARLVVHRDIKPSNILVAADGTVKLLDFGIAKLLGEDAEEGETLTGVGASPMTPDYASPEQVRGESPTTATDVYALGLVLYELLTGQPAHCFEDRTPAEVARVVCDVVPPRPSTAAKAPERVRRRLSGDLDRIVMTALHKDPARRYASAEALLEDLRRYRQSLPIHARPDTLGYRARKFVQRHRLGVVAGTSVALALIAGLAGTIWQARAAARAAARAEREAESANTAKGFLMGIFTQATPDNARGDSLTASEMLDRARKGIDTGFTKQPAIRLDLMQTVASIYRDLGRMATADTLYTRAVVLADSVHGTGADAAIPLYMLGTVRIETGKAASADTLVRRALAILRLHPDEDSLRAKALDVHGYIQARLNNFAAAESLARQAIVVGERARIDSGNMARFWSNLGAALLYEGKLAGADSALGRGFAIERRIRPPDHPQLAVSIINLASLKSRRWDMDSAIALNEDGLRRMRRIYPDGHLRLATVINNLADNHMRVGDLAAAEAGFREAHAMMERLSGPGHQLTLLFLNNIGRVLMLKGKPAEAEPVFRRAYEGARSSLGAENPFVSQPLQWLARAHDALGRRAAARAELDSALAHSQRLAPTRVADVRVALGNLDLREGRLAEAESILRPALEWRTKNLVPADPDIANAALALARCRAQQGARAEAETLFTDGIRRLEGNRYRTREAEAARRELDDWRARWR